MAEEIVLNDRYKIIEEIGRGGMGIVYRAEDTLLERPVAIKIVADSSMGSEGQARLNHPNIVAVYDVGQVELPDQDGLPSYRTQSCSNFGRARAQALSHSRHSVFV